MKCEYCGKINSSGMWTRKNKKVIWVCPECITQDMLKLTKEEINPKRKSKEKKNNG